MKTQKTQQRMVAWGRLAVMLPVALLLLCGGLLSAPPARASGDTLALTFTNSGKAPFVYDPAPGQPAPHLHVVLTLGAAPTANRFLGITFTLENGQKFGAQEDGSSGNLIYYFDTDVVQDNASKPIAAGMHQVYATFTNPDTNAISQSNTVNFSLIIPPTTLACAFSNPTGGMLDPGQALVWNFTVTDSPSQAAVDWQNGTFTVSMVGPTNFTTPPLPLDSNGNASVPLPMTTGVYTQYTCTFSGTSSFSAATWSSGQVSIIVSAKKKLGGAQIYMNPTTLVVKQSIQVYMVFKAAPGGPTPSGYFSITVGQFSTPTIKLGADGTALVKLDPIPELPPSPGVLIWFDGDPYYATQSFTFPATNPPIPGSGGGGGGGGGASATPTTTAAATGTATARVTPGETATTGSGVAMNAGGGAGPSGNNTPLWLIGALGMLVVLGAGGGITVYILRRRKASRIPA